MLTPTAEPTTTSRIDFVFARAGTCAFDSLASSVMGANAVEQPNGQWLWPSDHLGVVSSLRCGRAR